MALAVFVLGGAASGKTAVIRERYIGTLDVYPDGDPKAIPPQDAFSNDRRYDADDYKTLNPMFTPAGGDEESIAKFGLPDLGGPSGPKTIEEFRRYPADAQAKVEAMIDDLGFDSIEAFAREIILTDTDTHIHFGGGLTHELSKFMAAAAFEGQLEIGPAGGSVVWDATGNTERYSYWIELALERGFDVEIIYVTCPLNVALRRAAQRTRRVPEHEVRRTHDKAALVADALELMAGDHPKNFRITFETVPTSSPGEETEASAAGFGEGHGDE